MPLNASSATSVKFLGHCISKKGIWVDPDKTAAIWTTSLPRRTQKVYGDGKPNGQISPNIAEIGKPLCKLLSTKRARLWGSEQERAFNELKQNVTDSVGFVRSGSQV